MAVGRAGVAVIGCGLIGRRRAATAAAHPDTELRLVVDSDVGRARQVMDRHPGAAVATEWQAALERDDVDAIVVCTPNALLAPVAIAGLQAGRHVLSEKPMGRSVAEAEAMARAAAAAGRVLKVGFNHRYHPAIDRAARLYRDGAIGRLTQLRARYGHGSRPGCEQEWRASPEQAGGGELMDQGVHVLDLFHWFAGPPLRVQAEVQTAVWQVDPLEDNAWGLLRFGHGVVGHFHVSMTQWKNLFSLEVHGAQGALVVDGLGGSYGTERLTIVRRNPAGGVPELETTEYPGPDTSWDAEWDDFAAALRGAPLRHGHAGEGVAVMRSVAALYAAAHAGSAVDVATPAVFLDRDGVLNEVVTRDGSPGSPRKPDEFRLVADLDVITALRQAGYRTFIITNQPDLARGLVTPADVDRMMAAITERVPIDEVRICAHDDADGCDCRKPRPGMITDLAARWNLDLARSWVIGDMWRDVEAARAAGCPSILLRTPYNTDANADHVVSSLTEAVLLATAAIAPGARAEHVGN